jgi:hypothetical protein
MELKRYKILYNLLVNGEEYPNSIEISAIDQTEAKDKFKKMFRERYDTEYQIREVQAI